MKRKWLIVGVAFFFLLVVGSVEAVKSEQMDASDAAPIGLIVNDNPAYHVTVNGQSNTFEYEGSNRVTLYYDTEDGFFVSWDLERITGNLDWYAENAYEENVYKPQAGLCGVPFLEYTEIDVNDDLIPDYSYTYNPSTLRVECRQLPVGVLLWETDGSYIIDNWNVAGHLGSWYLLTYSESDTNTFHSYDSITGNLLGASLPYADVFMAGTYIDDTGLVLEVSYDDDNRIAVCDVPNLNQVSDSSNEEWDEKSWTYIIVVEILKKEGQDFIPIADYSTNQEENPDADPRVGWDTLTEVEGAEWDFEDDLHWRVSVHAVWLWAQKHQMSALAFAADREKDAQGWDWAGKLSLGSWPLTGAWKFMCWTGANVNRAAKRNAEGMAEMYGYFINWHLTGTQKEDSDTEMVKLYPFPTWTGGWLEGDQRGKDTWNVYENQYGPIDTGWYPESDSQGKTPKHFNPKGFKDFTVQVAIDESDFITYDTFGNPPGFTYIGEEEGPKGNTATWKVQRTSENWDEIDAYLTMDDNFRPEYKLKFAYHADYEALSSGDPDLDEGDFINLGGEISVDLANGGDPIFLEDLAANPYYEFEQQWYVDITATSSTTSALYGSDSATVIVDFLANPNEDEKVYAHFGTDCVEVYVAGLIIEYDGIDMPNHAYSDISITDDAITVSLTVDGTIIDHEGQVTYGDAIDPDNTQLKITAPSGDDPGSVYFEHNGYVVVDVSYDGLLINVLQDSELELTQNKAKLKINGNTLIDEGYALGVDIDPTNTEILVDDNSATVKVNGYYLLKLEYDSDGFAGIDILDSIKLTTSEIQVKINGYELIKVEYSPVASIDPQSTAVEISGTTMLIKVNGNEIFKVQFSEASTKLETSYIRIDETGIESQVNGQRFTKISFGSVGGMEIDHTRYSIDPSGVEFVWDTASGIYSMISIEHEALNNLVIEDTELVLDDDEFSYTINDNGLFDMAYSTVLSISPDSTTIDLAIVSNMIECLVEINDNVAIDISETTGIATIDPATTSIVFAQSDILICLSGETLVDYDKNDGIINLATTEIIIDASTMWLKVNSIVYSGHTYMFYDIVDITLSHILVDSNGVVEVKKNGMIL